MGYSIKNTSDTLKILEEAIQLNIRHVCFFALDDRPSNRKRIDLLNDCIDWIDQLSAEHNIITLLFARTETQYASNYRPHHFEAPKSITDSIKENLMEISKVYINPTFLIAQSLGLQTEFPTIILFDTKNENKQAKYQHIPNSIFDSTDKLESFLTYLYKSLDSPENWKTISFDIDFFRKKCQEIATTAKPVEVVTTNFLPFEQRRSVKIFISYASEDRESAKRIYSALKELGFDPWLDIYNITGGELWDDKISQSLEEADFFLACLSEESVKKRGFVQREYKRAIELWKYKLNSDIYVIPIKLNECNIPQEFQKFQWINYGCGEGLINIVRSVEEGLKRREE